MKLSILCRAACCWSLWFASRRRGLKGGAAGVAALVFRMSRASQAVLQEHRACDQETRDVCALCRLCSGRSLCTSEERAFHVALQLFEDLCTVHSRPEEGGECPWSPQARAFLCLGRRIRSSRRSLRRRGRQFGPANSVADFSWGS